MARGERSDGRLAGLARLFLKLGFTSFGGPAAHIAMMEDEVVARRQWMTRGDFLDLVGATNLIPGPNSTEMAIYIGFRRARWRGMLVSGLCFILPAVFIVLGLAVAYARFGSTPPGRALLYGIEPVVIAVVAQALFRLGRSAIRGWLPALVGAGSLAGYLLGVNELLLLFGSALAVAVARNGSRLLHFPGALLPWALAGGAVPAQAEPQRLVDLGRLFLVFLKVGALLYGSGYVLLAFLRADLVSGLEWLTEGQLIDAVAVGQMTPGPVFSTATFVGYLLHGYGGAAVATAAIFLPSFVFVAALGPLLPRLRGSRWAAAALDGLNAAAVGLLLGVAYQLGRRAIVDVPTALLALGAALALVRFRVNASLIVIAGGAVGLLVEWLR